MAGRSMFDMSDDEDLEGNNTDHPTNGTTSGKVEREDSKSKKNNQDAEEEDQFSDDEEFCASIEDINPDGSRKLNKAEKERAERNRLKALTLKKSRLSAYPYAQGKGSNLVTATSRAPKQIDTGGGFFIDEEEEEQLQPSQSEEPAPFLLHERPTCEKCEKKFDDSFLLRKFDYSVCDNCKETGRDEDHELITRTEAKSTFLLKDLDLEKCEHGEALKFITKKNPHNPRGGEMKLYLRLQVEERAVQVWGSQEALEEEIESREEKKVELKSRKYNRQMKALRMAARSSLYKKDISAHVHEFKDEIYHEDKDEYSQTCATCGYINVYEKM